MKLEYYAGNAIFSEVFSDFFFVARPYYRSCRHFLVYVVESFYFLRFVGQWVDINWDFWRA